MNDQILATKLQFPLPRPNLVFRKRLIDRLNEGITRKLTLISAPAGFGKTTLIGDWLRQTDFSAAWLSLDENDNDPVRFIIYLTAALQKIVPEFGRDLLEPNGPPPFKSYISALINHFAHHPQQNIALILDDYHMIEFEPIHDGLVYLLDHLPPCLHLVIASRTDPFSGLSRLRARGQLTELRAKDLRFNLEETESFLTRTMHLQIEKEDVLKLEARTEGWVSGLQLFALSADHHGSKPWSTVLSGRHRDIADYLAEEVLPGQPEKVQTFLLQTAFLDQLNGELCTAVTGHMDSQNMLTTLERQNLFIYPLDNERYWYRYHHLFRDFLRFFAQTKFGQEQINRLHQQAARWYEAQGLLLEAVQHGLKGMDWAYAAELIERVAPTFAANGQLTTLLHWFEKLPKPAVLDRPQLCLEYAWALLITGQFSAPLPYLQAAEEAYFSGRADAALWGSLNAIRAAVASVTGEVDEAITNAQRALQYLPEDHLKWRATATTSLGLAHQVRGSLLAADQALMEATRLSLIIGDIQNALLAMGKRGQVLTARGELKLAAAVYQEAIDLTSKLSGHLAAMGGMSYVGLGEINYQWNNLEKAADLLSEGIQLGQQWEPDGIPDILMNGCLVMTKIHIAQGNFVEADYWLDQAQIKGRAILLPGMSAELTALQVRLWLARGDLHAAKQWIDQLDRSTAKALNIEVQDDTLQRSMIRVILAVQQNINYQRLTNQLSRLQQQAEAAGRMGRVLETAILQATVEFISGDKKRAEQLLKAALKLAEPSGTIRHFADEGPIIGQLLLRIFKKQKQRPPDAVSTIYLHRVMTGSGIELERTVRSRQESGAKLKFEPLTDRELEILSLVAAGLSNREIAEQCVISLGTVKRHISNIFGKLQVKTRAEAATAARESRLI